MHGFCTAPETVKRECSGEGTCVKDSPAICIFLDNIPVVPLVAVETAFLAYAGFNLVIYSAFTESYVLFSAFNAVSVPVERENPAAETFGGRIET